MTFVCLFHLFGLHTTDPVPLIEESRALCPGGSIPYSFIHQVIIITGLNMTACVLALKKATGRKTSTQTQTIFGWSFLF